MKEFFGLLKNGTKSSLWAASVNSIIAIIKGITFFITGNVAMFAEMMHSLGDTANQIFVFVGSALSKKAPTKRFPHGFARLINLVLLGAVLVVGIMAYETIKEGIEHVVNPSHQNTWFWLNVSVLGAAAIMEAFVLYKAMKEVTEHAGIDVKGLKIIPVSFRHVKNTRPATKLVFLEDLVATSGALLAMLAIILTTFTPFAQAEGIASIIIGVMLFIVVGRVFLDNSAGALGIADPKMTKVVGEVVSSDKEVKDIIDLKVITEGEELHVELKIEVDPKLRVSTVDDIQERLEDKIMKQRGVTDVIIEIDEDDSVKTWQGSLSY